MYNGKLVVERTYYTDYITEESALTSPAVGAGNGLFEIVDALHPEGYQLPTDRWLNGDTAAELAGLRRCHS